MSHLMTEPTKWMCTQWRFRLACASADRMRHLQPLGYQKRNKWEPLLYWVNVQTNLSLCWSYRSYCRFCRALAHFIWCYIVTIHLSSYTLVYIFRYMNGKKIKASDIEGLEEMMTICSMCNDSSVDYNDVSTDLYYREVVKEDIWW